MSRSLLANTLWDMFLAVIPVLLGWALAAGMRRTRTRWWWLWTPLLLAWLFFLPNTCYLLTEVRHLDQRVDLDQFSYFAGQSGDELLRLFRWTAFYMFFSGFGIVSFVLAVRPLERLARERRLPVNAAAPLLFWLMSLGVYLGLRLRFNTWDVIRDPRDVLKYTLLALTGSEAKVLLITGFALFLWLLYLSLDIWLDGLVLRCGRWRKWWEERAA
jgi:uncharacterized membrane protein